VAEILRTVGRYEILSQLGRGGMAVVYLARQSDLDREVALKELPAFHAADPAFAARFLRESQIAGGLNHPNVVTVHDYFEHEGIPYISMEFMPRGSLRSHVGDLTLAQVAGVLEGVLAALAYAGGRGIVHRDLKPENLMLTWDGAVKVSDFGIAKAIDASSARFSTATGTTVGTPAYMAPEQAIGKTISPQTDLYAAGIIAYELLVGRVPFESADTPLAMMLQQINERPPSPRALKPDLDERLGSWVERMIAKQPDERPPGAAAAWEELEEIVTDILGPRWRRNARILERDSLAVMPRALTPAPFPTGPEAGGRDFRTYQAPPSGPPPSPSAAPPTPEEAAPVSPPAPGPAAEPAVASMGAARAPADVTTLPPTAPPGAPEFDWALEPEKPRRALARNRGLIGLGALLVVGGGVAAALALSGGSSTSPTPTRTLPASTRLEYADYQQQARRGCLAGTSTAAGDALAALGHSPTTEQYMNTWKLYADTTLAQRITQLAKLNMKVPVDKEADHKAAVTTLSNEQNAIYTMVNAINTRQDRGTVVDQFQAKMVAVKNEEKRAFRKLGLAVCAQ
jgi:serine/threonine protein kinase